MAEPILSICIPTRDRLEWAARCLEACIPQAEAAPAGMVEVVVSDNESEDPAKWPYLEEQAARHPCLRIHRNPVNNGTENFNTVVQKARGRYAWLMGDDDAPLPGAVARVLAEIQEHPRDLYLLHALEVDLEDHPLERRAWFRDLPRQDWDLRDPVQFREYLDHGDYMAAAFGFISILVFDREAWLEGLEASHAFAPAGWPHVAMGLQLARRHGRLRVLPDTLVYNHLRSGPGIGAPPVWDQIMHSLRGWVALADRFMADDPALRKAFMGVLRRNHAADMVLPLRLNAPGKAAWEESRALLVASCHAPQEVYGTELACQVLEPGRRPFALSLDPARMCFADLGLVARGARRTALLVRNGQAPAAAQLLAGLQAHSHAQLRVYGAKAPATPGVEWRRLDPERFVSDVPGRAPLLEDLQAFAPELVVNLDPDRHPAFDLLAMAHQVVAAVAVPAPLNLHKPELQALLDGPYHWILADAAAATLLRALGLSEEVRTDAASVFTPPPALVPDRQAFLMEPDWQGTAWLELLLGFLGAFQPGDPVALIFFLGQGPGVPTVEQASRKVMDAAAAIGCKAFPDVMVLDRPEELAEALTEFPVHARITGRESYPVALGGPFGTRLAQSLDRLLGRA